MELFLQVALAFPTVIFSVLLAVTVGYWLFAATGLVEIDALDGWIAPDIEGVELEGLAGLMMRFGLGGLPLMLILTVLFFFAWTVSYFADLLLLRHLPFAPVRILGGLLVLCAAPLLAVPVTGLVLKPVRGLFGRLKPEPAMSLLGRHAIVRSASVDAAQGWANVEDGGAGLILQIRTDVEGGFSRGDRVVIIEHLETENAYRVIAEDEFHGLVTPSKSI